VLRAHPEFRATQAEIPADALVEGVLAETLVDSNGAFRTFPPQHATDGFFAAVLARR
jgi:16S rRNA C967 or C1407 C5-methylase (RsmB/RsmF family)